MAKAPEDLIYQLGDALRRKSRADSARLISEIIRSKLPLGERWKSMAAIAKQNGEVEDAMSAMQNYCEAVGDTPQVRYELAALAAQLGRLADASEIMEKLPVDTPNPVDYRYSLGTLATNLGRFDEAREHLRLAVAAKPGSGQAWLALAMVGEIEQSDLTSLFAAAPIVANAEPMEQAAYEYAVGKAHDEAGQNEAAFVSFARGAEIMRNARSYSVSLDKQDAVQSAKGWAPILKSRSLDSATIDAEQPRPIFVTGLPRSGTTLVEQILASHSAVGGGEELGLMTIVTQDTGKAADDFLHYQSKGGSAAELAQLYLHLLAQRQAGNSHVVDKTLDASRYMGLIATIFPTAPIIWLRRDPVDCAWSAYRTWFLRGLNWTWSQTDIAAHFAIEDALFAYWQSVLGAQMLVVNYADLVRDPQSQIERITKHCRLSLEQAQLSPHETRRVVKTASVAQVRQPIHTNAIGGSHTYRHHLKPFLAAYDTARFSLPESD
jgi:tetratricopeptide (TPR) repeat protein